MVSHNQNGIKKGKSEKIQKLLKVEKATKIKPNKKHVIKRVSLEEIQPKLVLPKAAGETKPDKKVKYILPLKSITEDLVSSSLIALKQLTAQYKKKNTILEDETPVFAEIRCIKIQNSRGNIKFLLPHSTVASIGEICLITPDLKKGRKVDHEPTIDHWEELLRKADVTSVKTILPMRQLRVEYDQYELKRRLMTQHDFIMVDTRVLNHVSHLLGKMFFKKHNMLIPVRLNEERNLKKDIDVGLRSAVLRLSEGETSTITVGHTGMSQKELKENILALVQQLREKYPGGDANIRSISIKLPLSLSLPLYLTLRPSSTVDAPKLKQKKPKHYTELEDELSTIPGTTVRVAPDGTVHLKKSANNDSDMEGDIESDEAKGEESDKEE